MTGVFHAYDVRGIWGDGIDARLSERIGRAVALHLRPATACVGHDMRPSALPAKDALIRGLRAHGVAVTEIGLASTPMQYFATGHGNFDAGVQVTASHNPSQYIGFKISRKDVVPVGGDSGLKDIERLVLSEDPLDPPPGTAPGALTSRDIRKDYAAHVARFHRPGKRRLKVVADCANGMGSLEVDLGLSRLGHDLTVLFPELDGTFPNHEANPLRHENLRDLQEAVLARGADCGVAFDGDADRACFVDEKGQVVTNDLLTALIAGEVLPDEPAGSAVVYDLRSSRVVPETVTALGGRPIRERVGHAFMKARLRKEKGAFGGEYSGHFYFRDNWHADSGVIASTLVLNRLSREAVPFSGILAPLRRYRQTGEINFEVHDKDGKIREIADAFRDGEVDFVDGVTVNYPDWWFNVRKSNTEPLLRLNLEGLTPAAFEAGKARVMPFLGTPVDR
ncbi:MAG: phosphomannomutase/phosphoglucomutase [Planctomycetaceae bacterium]|nr:phosphomannomutase/phosphoglucomutase [Planctomycetota bacterium]NUN52727.1 phosphomannomutase/phosphoglucomutase [Planctomycetaceae bacterium]